VGQGLGAEKPERAEESVWIAGFINFLELGAVGIVFMVFTVPSSGPSPRIRTSCATASSR